MTAGTLEIGGNFRQNTAVNTNFRTSGTHKVILNGNKKQIINFANPGTTTSCFNILEINNTSSGAVEFTSNIFVVKDLKNTDSFAINTHRLCLAATAILSDNAWNYDLNIIDNRTLSADMQIGGTLYISTSGKSFDLNEKMLSVKGSVILSAGTLDINNGQLLVEGDFRQQNGTIADNGTITAYSNGNNAYLKMVNSNDYVRVSGNYINQNAQSHNGYLTNGILEVKGDFTQLNGAAENFFSTGNHKVILSGDTLQKVNFQSASSKFATLEIQNNSAVGVQFITVFSADSFIRNGCNITYQYCADPMYGWTLNSDQTHNGNLNLVGDTLDLNGYKLTINGDLIQPGGIISINNGELEITGDYKIQTESGAVSAGVLKMIKETDIVKVKGDFIMQSGISHSDNLTAGILEIGGDFRQNTATATNFRPLGTHKVILNGNKKQDVYFTNAGINNSCFSVFEITNKSPDGVVFSSDIYVIKELKNTDSVVINSYRLYLADDAVLSNNKWNYDLKINGSRIFYDDMEIAWTLYLDGGLDSIYNLNGYELKVGKNLILSRGTLFINGGNLLVDGDFRLQTETTVTDTLKTYSVSNGYLRMNNSSDYLLVNGNFIMQTNNNIEGYFINGVLEIKGDFTTVGHNNFNATGDHKIIFSGESLQKIDGNYPKFAVLEVRNFSEDGIWFVSEHAADRFIRNGCNIKTMKDDTSKVGWTLSKDEIFNGDLFLGSGELDLRGHKLTVRGNLIQTGGIVNINGGELAVTGDYMLQSLYQGASTGVLKMTKESDLIKVSGDFLMYSTISHSSHLTAGILEISGHFTQYSASVSNFKASGTHKTVLNGTKKQIIYMTSAYSLESCFNILEIVNTSSEGVEFKYYFAVEKELINTKNTPIIGDSYFRFGNNVVLNKWDYDLTITSTNLILLADMEIGGTLYIIYDGRIDLNGKTLVVKGDVKLNGGNLMISNGQLLIEGDFIHGDYSKLTMNNGNDYIKINKDYIYNGYYHYTNFTNGIIEIKGDFVQTYNDYSNYFSATGNHKIILSGDSLQIVDFDNSQYKFATLEIQNYSKEGIQFKTEPAAENFLINGCNTPLLILFSWVYIRCFTT